MPVPKNGSKSVFSAIDVFCGAGGLSLGAARAGLNVVSGVELDDAAFATHQVNFPNSHHLQVDVSKLSGAELLSQSGLKKGDLTALVGGPPCQGFSVIGARNPSDKRNALFGHFMRLVAETDPAFFVAENVPGIAHTQNARIVRTALSKVPKKYVILPPVIADGHLFGAPTNRRRLFFIGIDPERVKQPSLSSFEPPKDVVSVYVKDALRGLPKRVSLPTEVEDQIWCRVTKLPQGPFYERVSGFIPKGVGSSDAILRYKLQKEVNGHMGVAHSVAIAARYGALDAGEKDAVSRSVRLSENGHCPTLRAGTGSDRGRFQAVRPIHPTEPRVITPREAARLQGFPDWFLLPNTKWHSFRQIGNSVSPLVAEAVLKVLVTSIRK